MVLNDIVCYLRTFYTLLYYCIFTVINLVINMLLILMLCLIMYCHVLKHSFSLSHFLNFLKFTRIITFSEGR